MADEYRELDIIESVMERQDAEGFDALTKPEQMYLAIWALEAEANNGAFDQFFHNSSGHLADLALEGLVACGAHRMAGLFREAMSIFPSGEVPMDQEKRWAAMDGFSESQLNKLEDLSDQFVDYPDDLHSLLEVYVQHNEALFLGPKTLMEQWTARMTRGADTAPHGVLNWDLDKEAAQDAKSTDRKCPICGQPAPEYRATCKRCGYPYGRVPKR
jgi:hypothetical protein